MSSPKLPRRLFKNKDVVHTYQHERENKLGMKEMSRDHLDVLQNIEFVLVSAARADDEIDDRTLDEALRMALRGGDFDDDSDELAIDVCEMLEEMRETREDVPDNIWRAGLKTVRDSVRRHSSLAPGEKGYLRFVAKYVK